MRALPLVLVTALSCFGMAGCGDDTTSSSTTGNSGGTGAVGGDGGGGAGAQGGDGGGGEGGVAMIEVQIDRLGRPAINTAAVDRFLDDAGMVADHDAGAEDYNTNDDPTTWAQYAGTIQANVAFYDALADTPDGLGTDPNGDVERCNDQAFSLGEVDNAANYATIASVLANDVLWLNASSITCQQYLGVEAALLNPAIDDCGGRRPIDDVIERTYSLLAIGTLAGVDDGITVETDVEDAYNAGFPYLAAPNN